VRVGVHAGPLRRAIVRFKYHRQEKLDRTLAKLLLAAVEGAGWFGGVELIVPVPSHWTRRLQRGYDHVGLLARELAALSGKRFGQALEAARRIRPQVGLSVAERRENVRGAFRAGGWVGRCRGAVCLVDDVTTTGATLHEAGATLARAGLAPVYGAVLAKAGLLDDQLGGP
jgi:ComF family protein